MAENQAFPGLIFFDISGYFCTFLTDFEHSFGIMEKVHCRGYPEKYGKEAGDRLRSSDGILKGKGITKGIIEAPAVVSKVESTITLIATKIISTWAAIRL